MPILGMRGTGDWRTEERPLNWREAILWLEDARADAPLTAMLSKLRQEPTSDPVFYWFPMELAELATTVTSAYTSGATTISVADATVFKVGHVIMNTRTEERMRVTAVNASANQITVTRAFGTTAAAAGNSGDKLLIIGSAYGEGTQSPSAVMYQPSVQVNYCQIFKTAIHITGTALKTQYRTGDPYVNDRWQALRQHAVEMERAFIFGEPRLTVDTNGKPLRATGGILSFIPSSNNFDFSSGVTEAGFDQVLEQVFAYGNDEKLALCGPRALTTLNTLAKRRGVINMVPGDQTYGLKVFEYISPHGVLYLVRHPLFAKSPHLSSNMLIIDTQYLVYRYLEGRDTQLLENVQLPDEDARKDMFLTEAGLEVQAGQVHAYIRNFSNVTG